MSLTTFTRILEGHEAHQPAIRGELCELPNVRHVYHGIVTLEFAMSSVTDDDADALAFQTFDAAIEAALAGSGLRIVSTETRRTREP